MPRTNEMLTSQFLKKEDVGAGVLMTVTAVEQHNVAKQGAEPEMKWCLLLNESDKPLVLNSTNIQLCQQIFQSDDTDDWTGHQIVLYTDPTVSFQGKVIGGIRVRKPKVKAQPAPVAPVARTSALPPVQRAPLPPATDAMEDDIPFMWLLPIIMPLVGASMLLVC